MFNTDHCLPDSTTALAAPSVCFNSSPMGMTSAFTRHSTTLPLTTLITEPCMPTADLSTGPVPPPVPCTPPLAPDAPELFSCFDICTITLFLFSIFSLDSLPRWDEKYLRTPERSLSCVVHSIGC